VKVNNYTMFTAALASIAAINHLRNFHKVTIKPLLAPPCPSVCMYHLSSHWTNFFTTCDLETSTKICQETPDLIKISKNISRNLHVDLSVLPIAGSDILLCSSTKQEIHVCASIAKWQRFQYLLHC